MFYNYLLRLSLGMLGILIISSANAKPIAPVVFCENYSSAPACSSGFLASCDYCHASAPPALNVFGQQIAGVLAPDEQRPLSDDVFRSSLAQALSAIESLDADLDTISNLDEIRAGTTPADANSGAVAPNCDNNSVNDLYKLCSYDEVYAFKRVNLDFCGRSPSWNEFKAFENASDKKAVLHSTLDTCLDSEYWMGGDGKLWEIAHSKIRPNATLKSGINSGPVALADYDYSYGIWVYSQIDNHDAREVLTAQYLVEFRTNPTRYERVDNVTRRAAQSFDYSFEPEHVPAERRAGVLTTRWYLTINTMFTALPRTTAAQTMRAFLGMDISRLEGIFPVANEPVDYDRKGVAAPDCAVCHSTLDPLAYVFKNYHGLTEPEGTYDPNRIGNSFSFLSDIITNMPEEGVIFGQNVRNLQEWVQIAANSDAFASNLVADYWNLLISTTPTQDDPVFTRLWQDLKNKHNYGVERMLHDLIDTEAYGAP